MHPVEVHELRKEYELRTGLRGKRTVVAVESMSFEIPDGKVFGLLGPNGAGKTTTIKMLCTLITPSSGDAWVDGLSVVKEPQRVRGRIGVMLAGERSMYWKLTGRENLQYFAALYHVPPSVAKRRIEELLDLVSLGGFASAPVESYSTGMRIRLSFAKALINDAPVLLFDEPTMSLDPQSARLVRDAILGLRDKGKSILLTTHNLEEADNLSDRVGIVDHGKIIALGSPSQLKRSHTESTVIRVRVRGKAEGALGLLAAVAGVRDASFLPDPDGVEAVLNIVAENSPDIVARVLRVLADSRVSVAGITLVEPSLEDVFIRLTGRELRD